VHNTLYVFDTMIHWGKMQFKGISVNPKEFEVRPLVDNSVRLLKLNAELKELQIVNVIPPDTSLYADQDHFRFIMRNLLSNAIKYSRKGEEIRVGVKEVLANQVVFFVEDHGIGMSAEEVETLFDPDRSSIMGTNNETGHGIALMLSKEFVAKNGGEIWVDSKKGIGTTFYFSMNSKWNKQ
jgi:signal transduction histidine kinase